jgi:hypothetical protein
MSHRQVVIVLYAVSALFAMLSLFLLWPTGSTLGLVLAVLGTGIWLGVQHLGYLEFGEIRRVAQRTLDQRQIMINNLSIRRATEELKVSRDYDQICRVLVAAFERNDFDAFELSVKLLPHEAALLASLPDSVSRHGGPYLHWAKPGTPILPGTEPCWSLALEVITTSNRRRGLLTLHRIYTERSLQLDVNLLTTEFPVALADALDRAMGHSVALGSRHDTGEGLIAAQAG